MTRLYISARGCVTDAAQTAATGGAGGSDRAEAGCSLLGPPSRYIFVTLSRGRHSRAFTTWFSLIPP